MTPGARELLALALEAAREGARLVVDERPRGPLAVAATKSSSTDIVSPTRLPAGPGSCGTIGPGSAVSSAAFAAGR